MGKPARDYYNRNALTTGGYRCVCVRCWTDPVGLIRNFNSIFDLFSSNHVTNLILHKIKKKHFKFFLIAKTNPEMKGFNINIVT